MAKKTTTRKPVKILKKKAPTKAPSKKKVEEQSTPEILFDASAHNLVPKHEVMDQEAVEALFVQFKVSPQNLPVIFVNDPALSRLDAKMGDIIKITRRSPTAGVAIFYRRVAYE